MPKPKTRRRPFLQSILSRTPRARQLAADWHIRCAACGATVESHIAPGNRWIGCRVVRVTGGVR
jgi:hypothetical protein